MEEIINNRNDAIHEKGFNMIQYNSNPNLDYSKIKVGVKTLDDAVLNLGELKNFRKEYRFLDKTEVIKAMLEHNTHDMRIISNLFYDISGIYRRVCDYFAFMYRYDWYVAPEVYDNNLKEDKIIKDFMKVLGYLDNSYIKKICGNIALEVVKNGAYYGYIVPSSSGLVLQQLPVDYCRSRYNVHNMPAVEFDMRYFDTFADPGYRARILKLFPPEFAKGYALYKQNKLPPDVAGDYTGHWYLLEPTASVKFNFNNSDVPIFLNAIPAIIDLDAAQDLDRRKQMQKLLKIVIQKLPLDKNGDLIFDVDEAKDIHNNAVQMLRRAVGVDVLTTFADVDSIDMSDKTTTTTTDDLAKTERTVYNSLGIAKNLFNTDNNLSLEKSILNDESTFRDLLLQFNIFFDRITKKLSSSKKYSFRFFMLETTQYNYKELAKTYKEQTQIGYSKMLPEIALGHSQSFILNSIVFENDVIGLSEIMLPPLMSSTLSAEDLQNLGKKSKTDKSNSQNQIEDKTVGRPEKPDDQKSPKTIQNKESM